MLRRGSMMAILLQAADFCEEQPDIDDYRDASPFAVPGVTTTRLYIFLSCHLHEMIDARQVRLLWASTAA